MVTDKLIFELLLYINDDRVLSICFPNCRLSDAGATILFQYLEDQCSLCSLKLYNNITSITDSKREIPYLKSATYVLGDALLNKKYLHTLEIHGFFLNLDDYRNLFSKLNTC